MSTQGYDLGVDAGIELERDRIVKLLEKEEERLFIEDHNTSGSLALGHAIALIKGDDE
jgi:hypothetical protein